MLNDVHKNAGLVKIDLAPRTVSRILKVDLGLAARRTGHSLTDNITKTGVVNSK